jgi:hypothetical protein
MQIHCPCAGSGAMNKSKKREDWKKRRQLLGEAVCGFVNAQTADEAYFPILTGIQQIEEFNFSFIEEVQEVFPTMRNIKPPPKDWSEEKEEMTSYEDKFNADLREKLGSNFCWRYIRDDQCFELNSIYIEENLPLHSSLLPSEDEQISKMIEAGTLKLFANDPKLSEIFHNKALIEDISNLQKVWTRFNTIVLHKRIHAQQKNVRGIFDALINGKPIKEDYRLADSKPGYALSQYLKIYNEMPKYIVEVCQQDSLEKLYPTREEDYLSINLPLKWFDRIKSDLAYCLIEFLLSGYQKSLKRCDVCSKFLVHPTRKRCSDECRRIATKQYDTEYKQFVRLEQFVDDVKEKCKKADDLYLGENRKLLARMRKFRLPENQVMERLKKDLKEDS